MLYSSVFCVGIKIVISIHAIQMEILDTQRVILMRSRNLELATITTILKPKKAIHMITSLRFNDARGFLIHGNEL